MKTHNDIRCPGCGGRMVPVELRCEPCDLSLRGQFTSNEFATLNDEDLHFLRIFVLCEGKIGAMESAMGLSYASIKQRLARLKEALEGAKETHANGKKEQTPDAKETRAAGILKQLEGGKIDFEVAMAEMKKLEGQ